MAIAVKKTNGWSALAKLGFPEDKLSDLIKGGIDCKLTATAFEFRQLDGKGETYVIPVTLDDLMRLNSDKLPEKRKYELLNEAVKAYDVMLAQSFTLAAVKDTVKTEKIKQAFSEGFKTLLQVAKPEAFFVDTAQLETTAVAEMVEDQITMIGALSKLPKKPEPAAPKPPKPVAIKWPEFPDDQKTSAPLVHLRKATMMYQPVHGSSPASRYYVVAANADLRVAARVYGVTLSVRIEGPGLASYKEKIKAAGFDKNKSEYSSLHLDVGPDKVMLSKTLGAILLGLGIPMETPLPDLTKVPKG